MRTRFYPVVTALAAAAAASLSGLTGFAMAASVPGPAVTSAGLPSGAVQACPPPVTLLQEQCQVFVRSAGPRRGSVAPDTSTGFEATDLQAAYGLTGLSASNGKGETVAIVDAFHDPYAQSDLRKYRSRMGLPGCDPTTGAGCLTGLNQSGGTSPLPPAPPAADVGWEDETALDVEMVSAICPNCHIDLFQAKSADLPDMATAVNSAAKVAKFVSNSWSGLDFPGEAAYDTRYFNHPGVAIAFASGDFGFGAAYPASSQLVTSVGGTYLSRGSTGNWTQTVWNGQLTGSGSGTGAGCSSGEPKPAWQNDPGCANRTQNDVAAEAAGPDGTFFYSSAADCGGACQAFGTSIATPIIAAVYALAGNPAAGTYPVSYLYQDPSDLTHVKSGALGGCEASRRYLCNAGFSLGNGYNGPTGLGTPNGATLQAFTNKATGHLVSVINPGSQALQAGVHRSLPPIKAYDSAPGQTLKYSASGLPAGLTIAASTGAISGTLKTPVNALVHVTVTDGTASSRVGFRIAAVKSMITAYRAGTGEVHLDLGGMCLNDAHNSGASGAAVQVWKCNGSASQIWLYLPSGAPGGVGTVRIHGKCLNAGGTANGSKLVLHTCDGHASQAWKIVGAEGELYNPVSGRCLNDPGGSTKNGTQLVIWDCNGTARQAWTLPASPITSGVAGKCVSDPGNSASNGAAIVSSACNGAAQQKFTIGLDGTLRIHGKCLNVKGQATTDGSVVNLNTCGANFPAEYWALTAGGTIENLQSEKCLAVPANSAINGRQLALEDCYGEPGEIWAVS